LVGDDIMGCALREERETFGESCGKEYGVRRLTRGNKGGATAPITSCSHANCFITSATWLIGSGITTWADQGPCVACQDSAEPASWWMVSGPPYSLSYQAFSSSVAGATPR